MKFNHTKDISIEFNIINPKRKKDCGARSMQKSHGRFSSLRDLRVRLIEEFADYHQQSHSQLDIFQAVSQQNIASIYYTDKKIKILRCTQQLYLYGMIVVLRMGSRVLFLIRQNGTTQK